MKPYRSVVAVNGAVMVLMCGVGVIVTVLPHRILMFSGSIAEVGYLASAFALPYILVQLPIGHLADRCGYKRFLVGGYVLCAGAGLLYVSADTSTLVLVGRMVQGIGEAPLWALAPALLSRQYPAQKGRVIGLYHAAIHVGLLSGSLLGLLLLPRWHGTEAFFLFIMVSALGGVMVLWCVDDPVHISRAHTRPGHIASLLRLITRREIVSVLGAITVYGAGYGVFLTIVPAFLFTVNDVSQAGVGSAFLIFYLMISVAQLITGPLSDRIGSMWPMVCALLVVAVGMGSLVVVPFPWLNLVLGLISGGLGILAVSSLASVNERVSPALKGTLSGVCYVCWGVGYFLCPMIVGALGQHSQYAVGFCGFAGLCGFEAIVVLWGNIRSSSTSLVVSHHHR